MTRQLRAGKGGGGLAYVVSRSPALIFLLDTPNVWRGRALAGTPARVLALAEHAQRAGARVTLVLCDRGADYGEETDWPFKVVLVHPADYYATGMLARTLEAVPVDFLAVCEAESLVTMGRELAHLLDTRLVYDVHDDEAALAFSLGEPPEVVRRYAASQQAALAIADYVIVSTRHEAALAQTARIQGTRLAMLPNGADVRHSTCWGPTVDAHTLVFVGNLYYEPNARAMAAIRTMIIPVLRAAGIDVRARVIGRGPDELTQPTEGIEFTGRVDTINDALQGATIALAPLTAGSGAKMKVVDYLAAGLPVLGTREAVTGLPEGHPGVVVHDDLRAWPSLLTTLLRDSSALRRIGRDGRQCVERGLSWQQLGADLLRQAHSWLTTEPAELPANASPNAGQFSVPRWLADHAGHRVLGEPQMTTPGGPRWLMRSPQCRTGEALP